MDIYHQFISFLNNYMELMELVSCLHGYVGNIMEVAQGLGKEKFK